MIEKLAIICAEIPLGICILMLFAGASFAEPFSFLRSPEEAKCMKWDYYYHPVKITATGSPGWPDAARWAFDGYPSSVKQPLARNCWRQERPSADKPAWVIVDYGRPVSVARYTHYYERFRKPSSWKEIDIFTSDDGENWTKLQEYKDLQPDYPQIIGIDNPRAARYYKIAVKHLGDSAADIRSHEIETYSGAILGNASFTSAHQVQSEPGQFVVRVASTDKPLNNAKLVITALKESLLGEMELSVPQVLSGKAKDIVFQITPLLPGQIPVEVRLLSDGKMVDSCVYTLRIEPKLTLTITSPTSSIVVQPGDKVDLVGDVVNKGATAADEVQVSWMGIDKNIGTLAPGQSAHFSISAKAKTGYGSGEIVATASGSARTVLRRGVICKSKDSIASNVGNVSSQWTVKDDSIKMTLSDPQTKSPICGTLDLYIGTEKRELVPVNPDTMAAYVPGGVLLVKVTHSATKDTALKCTVVANDPRPVDAPWLDMELRFAVDNPKIMFNPHIDWYTVEHGPNLPGELFNGHQSSTRMLCIQTKDATISAVPDTDNMTWGFTPSNQISIGFQIPLAPHDELAQGIWRPISEAHTSFSITLPIKTGDWWDAFRYVTESLFDFEQPRQWAMPVTQMQMLTSRYVMRPEVWSEKWQTVRSHPNFDFFYNFYGTTYTIPCLYSWYLATDDLTAKSRAEKVVDWLIGIQEPNGTWFSQYRVEGDPPKLVGRDQAENRWLMPHSVATSAKTLLWYWEASGKNNARAFDAAKRGCDWLLSTQRADGGWPYAFDLQDKPVTELTDAGQIWCTWALWRMWLYTREAKYKDAAVKSKENFKRTFVDTHRYEGYWEDVSGAAGKVARSWEGYEPPIGCLVFTEMGDKELALACAKDTAVWSWTRVTSTRQYETAYGQTTEQSVCGPSQAQSPMVGVGLEKIYQLTGDKVWSDFSGAVKAINFCADPDYAYGIVATGGWDDPTTAVIGPPYEGIRPFVHPNNGSGDEYGRGIWNAWGTDQFAWLALQWLISEGNIRAPRFFDIDPDTLRGTVLGEPGRVKMPEEKCDVNGIDHIDINWVGYSNDEKYCLLVMNHKAKVTVAIRPHEAHLDVYTRPPHILIGNGAQYKQVPVIKKGVQYMVDIPENASAVLVWDRMK